MSSSKNFTTPTLSVSKTYYLGYKHVATNCVTSLVPVRAVINNYNSVKKYSARAPGLSQNDMITGGSGTSYKTFNYFDGLGRPNQTVLKQSTVSGKDLITPGEYDQFGRQVNEYLPYATSNIAGAGNFNPAAITEQNDYYTVLFGTNPFAYSKIEFESSPLNRENKKAAPGAAWKMSSTKETKFSRRPNQIGATGDSVMILTVNTSGLPVPGSL